MSFPITGSVSGNPFEAVVDGEFTHSSGTRIKLPGYYDGNHTWRFGFIPIKIGTWTWRTVSSQGSLDGETGSLTVVESGHPGLLKADPAHPRKWKYADGPYVVPIGAFVNAMLDNASDSQFTQMADFLKNNSFQLINFRISEHDRAFSNVSRGRCTLTAGVGWSGAWRYSQRAASVRRSCSTPTMRASLPSVRNPRRSTADPVHGGPPCGIPDRAVNSGIDIGEYRTGDWATWYGQQVVLRSPTATPYRAGSNW